MLAMAPMLQAGRADAAALHAFNVSRQPLGAALVQLALQAQISISTRDASGCAATGHAVHGRLTLEAALTRLLTGTGCTFHMVDASAVEVTKARETPRSPLGVARAAPDATPSAALDEVVVVATRRPMRADSLAYAVSAVDHASLSELGVHDVGDLAATTPAMIVTNLGAGRDKILLRGLSDGPLTGRTQSMVGVYLDDVRLTYNAPDPDLRLVDMARVEVLRGPQGALYGAGSLGGVIQLVTMPPRTDRFEASVTAGNGWTRGGAGSSLVEAVLNLPLATGRGAVRLVGYREAQGGYIQNETLDRGHVNQALRIGGRMSATLDLGEHWTASAGLVSQGINSDDAQYGVAGAPPYTRRNSVPEPHDNDFAEAYLGLKGEFDNIDAKWTTAFVRHRLASRYDATGAPPMPAPPGPVAYDDEDAIGSLVSEATLTSPASASVQWLAGAFYSRSRQAVGLTLTSLSASPTQLFSEVRHDRLDEAALFGELVVPLSRRVSLTLGGRAFLSDAEARSGPGPATSGPAFFSGQVSRTGFAPKIVLAYRRNATLLLYAQAAEGYRAGGINTTGTPGQAFSPNGGAEPNRFYQGDELWSFEAGVRASAWNGRFVVRSAVFEAVWRNIQSDQLLATGLPFTANIGDGRNSGWELEAGYAAGSLRLNGNVLANAPELNRANPAFPARPDLGLAGAPGVSAGVSAHYARPLAGARRLEVDGRYAYVGASHLTFDAGTSPPMGGYSSGRIAVTLADDHWRLTAAVENPANARGNTFAYGNPFTLRNQRQLTPLRPTTVTLGLSFTF
jgi:iron complex outermembrane receptor protein